MTLVSVGYIFRAFIEGAIIFIRGAVTFIGKESSAIKGLFKTAKTKVNRYDLR